MKRPLTCISVLLSLSLPLHADELTLFDLSLEDLLKIDLSGDSVRQMELNNPIQTANPFNQSNLNLPYSVEVISADSISAKGINNIIQAAESMTGILSGESPSEPYSFSMRGFSRDSIDVTYDGISLGLSTLNMRPQSTFNVEQIEVIKGAATLNNGQGAAGGTIDIITKKASLAEHHKREAYVSIGEYNTQSYNLGVSGPISSNVGYRVDLIRNQSDGWVEGTDSFTSNVSGSVFWEVNDEVDVLFSLIYLDDELPAYWGTPFVPESYTDNPLNDIVAGDTQLTIDKDTRFNNYNVSDNKISSESLWKKIDLNWQPNEDFAASFTAFQFVADRDWQNAESYFFNPDIEEVERDRLLVIHDRQNQGFIGKFNLNHTIGGLVSRTNIQLEYLDMALERDVGFNLSSPSLYLDSVDLYNPEQGEFGYVDKRFDSTYQTTSAVTLNNYVELTGSLLLNTSFRLENINLERNYVNWDGSIRERATGNNDYNELSYFIGLTQKLSTSSSLYTHYSFSHDPIFADFLFVYNVDNLEPSSIDQLEIGYKTFFHEGDTELTIAAYLAEKSVVTQLGEESLFFDSVRKIKGGDFSFSSKFTEQFLIGGHLAYTYAQYNQYFDPELGLDVSDKKPMNTPAFMGNIRFSYALASQPIEFGGSINYVSSRIANGKNTIELSPYHYENFYISYSFNNSHIAIHINNISDEVYAPWSDLYYPNQVIIAPPRKVELSYRVNF